MKEQDCKQLTLSQAVSHANLTALLENVKHLMMTVTCGGSSTESFARFTQDSSLERMYGGFSQVKMDGFSDEYCQTFPDWGGGTWWYCFPARAIGASFRGDRVAIVATTSSIGRRGIPQNEEIRPDFKYLEMLDEWKARQIRILRDLSRPNSMPDNRHARNDDGLSSELDRWKCLGNSVVPYQFYPIFKVTADILLNEGDIQDASI